MTDPWWAHLAFDPEARVSVILLRNYGSGDTNLGKGADGLVRELAGRGGQP